MSARNKPAAKAERRRVREIERATILAQQECIAWLRFGLLGWGWAGTVGGRSQWRRPNREALRLASYRPGLLKAGR